jgi:putative RNA 2'-phosphotransferase
MGTWKSSRKKQDWALPEQARLRIEAADLSRAVSHALRHEPWLYELEIDDEGWTRVDDLLGALRQSRSDWKQLSKEDFEEMIARSEKRRHEISGDKIRALYGHSLPGKLKKTAAQPPLELFHGTTPSAAALVLREGLKPMGRQFVHLSIDLDTAVKVGKRKCEDPVILLIYASLASASGIVFYRGNETVWLADGIPCPFIRNIRTSPPMEVMTVVPIRNELLEICRQIIGEGKTEAEWREMESDDMYRQGPYSGGFDAAEKAFCFSFISEGNEEFWFQFTLGEAAEIAMGNPLRIEGRPAE